MMLIYLLLKITYFNCDSRTNTSNIIDYIIYLPAMQNNIKNLPKNNNLSLDYSAILLNFSTKINNLFLLQSRPNFIIKLTGTLSTLLSLTRQLFFKAKFLIYVIPKIQILSTSLMHPVSSLTSQWTFTTIFQRKPSD